MWFIIPVLAVIALLIYKPTRPIMYLLFCIAAGFYAYDGISEDELSANDYIVRSLESTNVAPQHIPVVRLSGEVINRHAEAELQRMDFTVNVYDCEGSFVTEQCDLIGQETKTVQLFADPNGIGSFENVYYYFDTQPIRQAVIEVETSNAIGDWS